MNCKIDRISLISFVIGIMVCDPIHFLFVKFCSGGVYYAVVMFALLYFLCKIRLNSKTQRNMFISFVLFAIFMSLYYQLFSDTDIRSLIGINVHGYVLYYLESLLALCIYFFADNFCNTTDKRRLQNALFAFIIINCVVTILACVVEPNISRINAMGVIKRAQQTYTESFLISMASTYSFASAICVIMPFFLRKKKHNAKYYITILLMLVSTMMMGFSIMTFCVLFALILYYAFQFSERKRVIFSIVIVIILIFIFINMDNILLSIIQFLTKHFPDVAYIDKLSDIHSLLAYGEKGLAISGRIDVYENGILAFLKHPILGNVLTEAPGSFVLSGHSSILDIFALWGIVFSVPFVQFLVYLYAELKRKIPKEIRMPSYIILIVIMFLNPTVQYCHIWFAMYIFMASYERKEKTL